MTKEDKELLLKDLCARLPYGVKAKYYGVAEECECCDIIEAIYPTDNEIVIGQYGLHIDNIKPYLFPLSSITEEQKKEEYEICKEYIIGYESDLIDFYNRNHIDYRGLIAQDLALDATGLNIY